MYFIGKYRESDLMSDLICDNYTMLLVINRFGISLGFGDHTIEEVCKSNNVDTITFLAVVNLLINNEREEPIVNEGLSAESLINYLKNSHSYYLNFKLPTIRINLLKSLDGGEDKITNLIIHYFDEYVSEVSKHMNYEEEIVFSYVESLIKGKAIADYNISIFSEKHNNIDIKLTDLKNIIIKYYSVHSSNELNSLLCDIFSCANDLHSHSEVEDFLFIPLVKRVERGFGL